MKKLLIAALLPLTGCTMTTGKAEFQTIGTPTESFAYVRQRCNARYSREYDIQSTLYGPYGDWTGIVDSAKDCMARHGYQVTGFRQPSGKLTAYPWYDKTLDY
jgi:hypothetical protein